MSDLINPTTDQAFFPRVNADGLVSTAVAAGQLAACLTTAGAVIVLLPSIAGLPDGTTVIVQDADGDADDNQITVTPDGAETIDGATSLLLAASGEVAVLVIDGGEWRRAIPERLIPGQPRPYSRAAEIPASPGTSGLNAVSGAFTQDMASAAAVVSPLGLAVRTIILTSTPALGADQALTGFPLPASDEASYTKTIWNNQSGAFDVVVTPTSGTTANVPMGETWDVLFTPAGAQLVGA